MIKKQTITTFASIAGLFMRLETKSVSSPLATEYKAPVHNKPPKRSTKAKLINLQINWMTLTFVVFTLNVLRELAEGEDCKYAV